MTIATKIITENGGQLRSFNGDSVLAFFPGQLKSDIENAVRTAFRLRWALTIKFDKYFSQFSKLDFCIGIDWGDVLIVRAGLPMNDNNNDLVFLGMCVNFASAIANQGYAPNYIEISNTVYANLTDDWLNGMNNGVKQNMWKDGTVHWKSKVYNTKLTSWYQEIKD